jgi:serine O-acetyltransferase
MLYSLCRKSHGKRFLSLQFPSWDRRRPHRLAGANARISESIKDRRLHAWLLAIVVCNARIRAGENAGAPRGLSFAILHDNQANLYNSNKKYAVLGVSPTHAVKRNPMFTKIRQDIRAVFDRDPAARSWMEILTAYPGVHAIWFYRISHWFWIHNLFWVGRFVSHIGRLCSGVEIHPGAKISSGFFIDHGMGVVIGETTEIGPNVTLYHGVTLGGTSWQKGKRHPTLEENVVVGAGAKILGPITIGARTRVGANAVVVKDVPPDSVVVGIPGRVTHRLGARVASDESGQPRSVIDLDHGAMPDMTGRALRHLAERIQKLENRFGVSGEESQSEEDNWFYEI